MGSVQLCCGSSQSRSVDQRHAEMEYIPEKKAHFVKDLRSVNGVSARVQKCKNVNVILLLVPPPPAATVPCIRVGYGV